MKPDESIATQKGGSCAHVTENKIGQLLSTDPLLAAEKITGKSCKDNEATASLGMGLQMQHARAKEAALRAADDTHYNSSLDEYLRVVDDLGFEMVSRKPFIYSSGSYDAKPVELESFIYLHPEGVVLTFDSWHTTYPEPHFKINSAQFSYNWLPSQGYWDAADAARAHDNYDLAPPRVTSSGGYENRHGIPAHISNPDYDPNDCYNYEENPRNIPNPEHKREDLIYAGYHDGREGLRYHFGMLQAWGSFVKPWVECPFGRMYLFDPVEGKEYFNIKRREAQDAAYDAHIDTWPEPIKELTHLAVEHERANQSKRIF